MLAKYVAEKIIAPGHSNRATPSSVWFFMSNDCLPCSAVDVDGGNPLTFIGIRNSWFARHHATGQILQSAMS